MACSLTSSWHSAGVNSTLLTSKTGRSSASLVGGYIIVYHQDPQIWCVPYSLSKRAREWTRTCIRVYTRSMKHVSGHPAHNIYIRKQAPTTTTVIHQHNMTKNSKTVLKTARAPPAPPPPVQSTQTRRKAARSDISLVPTPIWSSSKRRRRYAMHESTSKIAQIVTCKRQKKWSIRGGPCGRGGRGSEVRQHGGGVGEMGDV